MGHKVSSMTTAEISNSFQTVIRGASSWFVHLQKLKPKFVKFTIRYPCQSSPSFTILLPLWFTIICLSMFFYLRKRLFPVFLQFEGDFVHVHGQNKALKIHCLVSPLKKLKWLVHVAKCNLG